MVTKISDKLCKRCHGKGWAQWGSIYGPCNRCGGETGREWEVLVPESLVEFTETLARIQAEGEAAKKLHAESIASGAGVLTIGSARRATERARREYAGVLLERQAFIKKYCK